MKKGTQEKYPVASRITIMLRNGNKGGRVLPHISKRIGYSSISKRNKKLKKIQAKVPRIIVKFIVKSPEEIVLKAARRKCIQDLEKWRRQIKEYQQAKNPSRRKERGEGVPEYFKKKKLHQTERRWERRQLIRENAKELQKIYGGLVYTKGWRISRQSIKKALGLEDSYKPKPRLLPTYQQRQQMLRQAQLKQKQDLKDLIANFSEFPSLLSVKS